MPKQHMMKFASAKLRKEKMFHSSFIILRIQGLLGSNIADHYDRAVTSGSGLLAISVIHILFLVLIKLFDYQKADDKIFVYNISKTLSSKPHHIENLKTTG